LVIFIVETSTFSIKYVRIHELHVLFNAVVNVLRGVDFDLSPFSRICNAMNVALARIYLVPVPHVWNSIRAKAGVEYQVAAAAPLCREVDASCFGPCLRANLIQGNWIASVL
jgi:hypothetical protein